MASSNGRSASVDGRCGGGLIALAVLVTVATPSEAQAYLDPATGGAFFQILVATVMGGLFALKMYGRRLKAFFTGRPAEQEPPRKNDPPPSDPES
jgi:hypothetical protein